MVAFALAPTLAESRANSSGHRSYHSSRANGHASTSKAKKAGHKRCKTCKRDKHGRILRSEKAKRAFMKQSGHPHGWPGHVVDHTVALEDGGADTPSNMEWQTIADAKAKDKTE